MDIQSASSAAAQSPASGTMGAAESAANVSKIAADSTQEQKELDKSTADSSNQARIQKSFTEDHIGQNMDVSA